MAEEGVYIVEIIRTGGTERIQLSHKDFVAKVNGSKISAGKYCTITFPNADLILISSANDPGFLADANNSIPLGQNRVWVANVNQAITAVSNRKQALGRNISVVIIDHGNVAVQCIGAGKSYTCGDGKHICDNAACTDLATFTAGINGKVTSLHFYGCMTGKGTAGEAFLQQAADGSGAPITGYTGSVICVYRLAGLINHWEASDSGNSVTKNPQP